MVTGKSVIVSDQDDEKLMSLCYGVAIAVGTSIAVILYRLKLHNII